MPVQDPPLAQEPLDDQTEAEMDQAVSIIALVQTAKLGLHLHLLNGSPAQLGCKTRGHIEPLLHISAVCELIVN